MILQITTDQLEELKKVTEHAAQGNYVPLLIVAGVIMFCFSLMIALLINWYKKDQRIIETTLTDHDQIMKKLTETTTELKELTKYHDKDIERLKDSA